MDAELALSRLQVADLKAHYDAVVAWLGLLEASGEVANAGEMLKNVKPVEETMAEEPAKASEEIAAPSARNDVSVASADSAKTVEPAAAPAAEPANIPASVPADSAKTSEAAAPAAPAN